MNYQWNWNIFWEMSPDGVQTYWDTLLSGLAWTMATSLAGWVIALALGFAVGAMRTLPNRWLRMLGTGYVELFRNVPLLVQMLVWYLLLVEYLPDSAEAWRWGEAVFLSKAGLVLPFPVQGADGWHWSVPALDGFAFEGGAALSPEFLAVKHRLDELIHPIVEVEDEKIPMVKLTPVGEDIE